jgi:hypothetical protein
MLMSCDSENIYIDSIYVFYITQNKTNSLTFALYQIQIKYKTYPNDGKKNLYTVRSTYN